ncbi:MAG: SDR family NAD(P)-dependent oxidoreductase [Actinomycetota bacterium]|nr:SDR family oxidoreductase [Actinomycetota bacterium]
MSNEFSLEGKVALVTGASRGIGKAIAIGFARYGADVAVAARTVSDLEETAKQIEATGRRAVAIPCDVTDTEQVESMVAKTIADLGGLHIVVNNAGGTRFMAPIAAMRQDGWDKVIDLNMSSIFRVCKAVSGHLMSQGGGSVINVASIDGVEPTPLRVNYSAAKAGVIAMTRVLAQEWAAIGVRVNTLSPGAVETDIWGSLAEDDSFVKMVTDRIPMGRWATAEEMVGAAVFLASDASSYVTGANLIVDGGTTA